MSPLMKLAFGKKAEIYMNFKDRLPYLTKEEIKQVYVSTADTIKRESDLTAKGLDYILNFLKVNKKSFNRICDISCGRGFLTQKIAELGFETYGMDIYIGENLTGGKNLKYVEADICNIPVSDNFFDCVICSKTLEHVLDLEIAIKELRRVCKKALIIVVPSQRPYRYTFDLHCNFFPYPSSLQQVMKNPQAQCFNISGGGGGILQRPIFRGI
jgi:ubiquinone/menaquinone biosynthesis C-methylase UbiE